MHCSPHSGQFVLKRCTCKKVIQNNTNCAKGAAKGSHQRFSEVQIFCQQIQAVHLCLRNDRVGKKVGIRDHGAAEDHFLRSHQIHDKGNCFSYVVCRTGQKADRQAVVAAAGKSAAGTYIDGLPDGYDTPLMRIFEPNGTELSVGQWQKIAVARAFYADSDILILDEPTASLDPLAEQEIFNQFDALRSQKTTIFVSHRLSSATIANRIIVLEEGRIIEMGSHKELMALEGKYYELFSTQAKRYLETQ